LLWFAQIGRTAAMWMEQIARPVLILQLTDSALQVGLVVAARMAPQLIFGLPAGVIADRFDRKRIMLAAQLVTTSTHFVLAALVLTDVVEPWHVFALASVTGTSLVFNQTSRQALIPQIVPSEHVLNAVALNMMALNLMRIAGPAVAGLLLLSGIGEVYLLSGLLGLGAIAFVSVIDLPGRPRPRSTCPAAGRRRSARCSATRPWPKPSSASSRSRKRRAAGARPGSQPPAPPSTKASWPRPSIISRPGRKSWIPPADGTRGC